jgi:hypothetical protein
MRHMNIFLSLTCKGERRCRQSHRSVLHTLRTGDTGGDVINWTVFSSGRGSAGVGNTARGAHNKILSRARNAKPEEITEITHGCPSVSNDPQSGFLAKARYNPQQHTELAAVIRAKTTEIQTRIIFKTWCSTKMSFTGHISHPTAAEVRVIIENARLDEKRAPHPGVIELMSLYERATQVSFVPLTSTHIVQRLNFVVVVVV